MIKFIRKRVKVADDLITYRGSRWTIIVWKRFRKAFEFYRNDIYILVRVFSFVAYRDFKKREAGFTGKHR